MPVYVICPHSVMRSGAVAATAGNGNALHHAMTAEVEAGRLIFPRSVVRDCRDYDDGAQSTLWVNSVFGSVVLSEVSYENTEWVMDECPEVDDEFADDWQANVEILAIAHYLVEGGDQVVVVTDDRLSSPARTCLVDACSKLGFEYLSSIRTESLLGFPSRPSRRR